MGGSQSNITTKNTFVDIDISQHDGTAKDPRKVQSYSGPVPARAKEGRLGDSCSGKSVEGNDSLVSSDQTDDWITERQRLKTNDPFECDDSVLCMKHADIAEPPERSPLAVGGSLDTNESLVANELADDWMTDLQRLTTNDPLECRDSVLWMQPASNARLQEHSAVAMHVCAQPTQLAGSAPATKQKGSFWSSWNIGDAARKSMQERAMAATGAAECDTNAVLSHGLVRDPACIAKDGVHASAGAQLPTLLPVRPGAANDKSQFCKQKGLTTSLANVPTDERVIPGKVVPKESWTCRMVRNLPNDYTRSDVLELLDSNCLSYDFVYVPIDWRKKSNLGYAFVNLISHEEAKKCAEVLNGYKSWKVPSEKICEVVWGKEDQQGLHKNIERYRNSPVMHPNMPEEFKPLLFTLGQRTAFPAPTERLKRDRRLTASWWQSSFHASHSPIEPEPEPQEAHA